MAGTLVLEFPHDVWTVPAFHSTTASSICAMRPVLQRLEADVARGLQRLELRDWVLRADDKRSGLRSWLRLIEDLIDLHIPQLEVSRPRIIVGRHDEYRIKIEPRDNLDLDQVYEVEGDGRQYFRIDEDGFVADGDRGQRAALYDLGRCLSAHRVAARRRPNQTQRTRRRARCTMAPKVAGPVEDDNEGQGQSPEDVDGLGKEAGDEDNYTPSHSGDEGVDTEASGCPYEMDMPYVHRIVNGRAVHMRY